MSKDLYNDPFKDPIVRRIIAKERYRRRRIDAIAYGESEEELHKLYNERYNIFLAADKMPIHPLMKVIFSSMASDVKLDVLLFKVRKDFEEQEDEIKTMKENQNANLRSVRE
jgi:hypothetical protein